MLPEYFKGSIGFGGTFKNKMINHPVQLTFGSNDTSHRITYGSGFQVVCIPPDASPETREKMIKYTPCVLGMDILSKFKMYLDKKKVELTLV